VFFCDFLSERWRIVLKNRISARIYHGFFKKIWRKILETFAERRACFQFLAEGNPTFPPSRQAGTGQYNLMQYYEASIGVDVGNCQGSKRITSRHGCTFFSIKFRRLKVTLDLEYANLDICYVNVDFVCGKHPT